MTGRPATCTRGFGTRLVSGRSRVPFPASGTMTFISHSPVAVLETHHVVDLGGRGLEEVGRDDRLELMDQFGLDMEGSPLPHAPLDQGIALLDAQDDLPREYVDRLVLLVVVLERQHVPGLDMKDLADVAVGPGPAYLVTPRLVHAIGKVGHTRLSLRDEGVVTQAVTHTPHPTQPSGPSTGRPPSSIARARSPRRAEIPRWGDSPLGAGGELAGEPGERLAKESTPIVRARVHQKLGLKLTCHRNASLPSPSRTSAAYSKRFTTRGNSNRMVHPRSRTSWRVTRPTPPSYSGV